MSRALLALGLLLGGCLDDALGIPDDGGAPRRDLATALDLRGVDLRGADLSQVDLATAVDALSGCSRVAMVDDQAAETRGSPTEAPFDFVTWARTFHGAAELSVEVWHDAQSPTPPYTLPLPSDTNYLLCDVCVLIDLGYDAALGYGSPAYLALGGSVTVAQAGTSPTSGALHVSGTGVHLVEWDFAGDRPLPGGGCYDVDAFDLVGTYHGDGGDPPRWK